MSFGSGQSEENKLKGDTQPPYEQFEKCERKTCVYLNNGRCIWETCKFDNEDPGYVQYWDFECQACHKIDQRDVRDMKLMFCDSCLERLAKAERLPFTCIICGKTQSSPPKGFSTPICNTCLRKLRNSVHCKYCGNA